MTDKEKQSQTDEQYFDDDFHGFENHETEKKLPIGWLVIFIGLIIFAIAYSIIYNPWITGWNQLEADKDLHSAIVKMEGSENQEE